VSSVDLFAIIDDLRVDELQGALDAVTFSEFTPSDVKRSSIESTTKLVHLMQLMIEYLLYCQEAELQLIHELRDELADWKRANKDLRKENVGLKEDISIYKRQMAALNKSLSRVADRDDNGKIIYRAVNEPTAPKSSDIKPLLEPICQMIESVQKHERDTRDFMMESLHEQRQLFIQQLSEMHAKTSSGQGDLRELLETQWRQQADKDNEKLRELVKANESLHDELARKDSEVLNAQREAQAARDTVAQRDGTIRELERDIAEKSRAIKAAELQKLKEDTIKKDIPTNKSVELFRVKSRHGAILSIFGVFQNGTYVPQLLVI
jgi:septal ring factor EnvC (AmiA/AmiB activator)